MPPLPVVETEKGVLVMTESLSAYELQRIETIRQNALAMAALGLIDAAQELRETAKKPKVPKQPRQPKPAQGISRRSRRLTGDAAENDGVEDEEEPEPYRDPNNVSQMRPAELKAWCDVLREGELKADWVASLDAEQKERLAVAQEWLAPFTEFTARFGGKNETTMSRANVRSVLKRVFQLVSGAGVTTNLRDGAFAAGRPITLGIQSDEVDALRAEAQLWCPLKSAPADLLGRVVNGELIKRKADTAVVDTSNG